MMQTSQLCFLTMGEDKGSQQVENPAMSSFLVDAAGAMESSGSVVDPHVGRDGGRTDWPVNAVVGNTAPDVAELANGFDGQGLQVVAVIPIATGCAAVNAGVLAGLLHLAALDRLAYLGARCVGFDAMQAQAWLAHLRPRRPLARGGLVAPDAGDSHHRSTLLRCSGGFAAMFQAVVNALQGLVAGVRDMAVHKLGKP